MKSTMRRVVLSSLVLGLITACTSAPNGPGTGTPGAGGTVAKTIGSEGGTLESNGVTVVIPPGAIAQDAALSLGLQSANGLSPLPEGLQTSGLVLALLPHGTQFATPVRVTLPSQGGARDVYRLADEADLAWEPVTGVANTGSALTFETSVFSFYVAVSEAEAVLREGELLFELEVPIVSGFNTLRDWGLLMYDRGSLFWATQADAAMTLWRLRVDAGPGVPTQVITTPAVFPYSPWQLVVTQDHLVWGDDSGATPGSVAKDGSGYREILATTRPSTAMFSLGAAAVIAGGGPAYPWDVFSPATNASVPLASAFVGLSRRECVYDAANNVAACVIGQLTTDGVAGDGVETFDFVTNERRVLARSNELNLATGRPGSILQNATHWFALSGGFRQGVVAWPKSGGPYQVLDGVGNVDFAYAVDDQALYVCRGTFDNRGELTRVMLNDFQMTRLSNGCFEVLGVDDRYIYFYERKQVSNSPNPRYLFKRLPR